MQDGQPAPSPDAARRRAINAVRSGLVVKRTGVSYAITVAFSGSDPERTAAIVNGVVDQYIADQKAGREGQRSAQSTLLRDRITGLRRDVMNAEQAVANYRARTNLIDIQKDGTAVQQEIWLSTVQPPPPRRNVPQRKGAAAGHRSVPARQETNAFSAVRRSARSSASSAPTSPAATVRCTPTWHGSTGRSPTSTAPSAARRAAPAPTSPPRRRSPTDGWRRSVPPRCCAGRLDRRQRRLGPARRTGAQRRIGARALPGVPRPLSPGRRRPGHRPERRLYHLARAGAGRPRLPDLMVFLVAGLLAGLLAAAAMVLILELLESGFRNRRALERQLGIPVLGTVPDVRVLPGARIRARDPMGPADYLVSNEGIGLRRSLRSIRAALRLGHPDQRLKTLAVTSALPNEGKTTTSICLARSGALAGLKTVLVDCDVRRRASSRSMASGAQIGLVDVLKGNATIDQALVQDTQTGAFVLSQGAHTGGDYDLIISTAMEKLIAELGRRFDLVGATPHRSFRWRKRARSRRWPTA
ncbi:hypothetical protein AB5I41_17250 [Sphingomonas sp. MMS24-JH45]